MGKVLFFSFCVGLLQRCNLTYCKHLCIIVFKAIKNHLSPLINHNSCRFIMQKGSSKFNGELLALLPTIACRLLSQFQLVFYPHFFSRTQCLVIRDQGWVAVGFWRYDNPMQKLQRLHNNAIALMSYFEMFT